MGQKHGEDYNNYRILNHCKHPLTGTWRRIGLKVYNADLLGEVDSSESVGEGENAGAAWEAH